MHRLAKTQRIHGYRSAVLRDGAYCILRLDMTEGLWGVLATAPLNRPYTNTLKPYEPNGKAMGSIFLWCTQVF